MLDVDIRAKISNFDLVVLLILVVIAFVIAFAPFPDLKVEDPTHFIGSNFSTHKIDFRLLV